MDDNFNPYHAWLGIPPAEQPADFYRLLGISRFEADLDVISNAADARMVYVRTFQSSARGPISQKILNELSAAKLCLLDPQKKTTYDQQLHAKMAQIAAARQAASQPIPVAGLQPASPLQPIAARPLAQAQPLVSHPVPQQNFVAVPTHTPVVPLPAQPYPTANPSTFSTNITTTPKKIGRDKSGSKLLTSAMIGGGIALLVVVVIVAVIAANRAPNQPQITKNTVDKNNSTSASQSQTTNNPTSTPPATSDTNIAPPTTVPPTTSVSEAPVAEAPPTSTTPPLNTTPPPTNPSPPPDVTASAGTKTSANTISIGSDLFAAVPTDFRRFKGAWHGNSKAITMEASKSPNSIANQINFRVAVPDEYEIEAKISRANGDGGVGFGIMIGGKLCVAVIDGWAGNGFLSGLKVIDGRSPDQSDYAATPHRGRLITNGKESTIQLRVLKSSLLMFCDGEQIFSWQGNPDVLGLSKEITIRDPFFSLITWESEIEFRKFRVTPAGSEASTRLALVPRNIDPSKGAVATVPTQPQVIMTPTSPSARLIWTTAPDQKPTVFTKTPTGWLEHVDGKTEEWEERSRNDQYVEISNRNRSNYLRLYADRCDLGKDDKWATMYRGSWGAVGPPGIVSTPTGEARLVWTTRPGPRMSVFRKTSITGWVEQGNDGTVYQFQEQQRNDQFIQLLDASRNVAVRLYKDRCDIAAGIGWRTMYFGKWTNGVPVDAIAGPVTTPNNAETSNTTATTTPANSTDPPEPPRSSLADIKKPKPPDEATYTKKQEEVHAIFGDEIKKAKKPEDKVAAAQRLIEGARKLFDDPDARYVMLDEARTLAAEGNQLPLALQTVDTLTQSYDFSASPMKLDTLKKAVGIGSPMDQRRQVLDALVLLAGSAADEGNFDTATDAADFMAELAKKGKFADQMKTGVELKAEIAKKKKVADEIHQIEERLAADPDDADANVKAGRYYCFTRNDWNRGLKHLMKGGSDDLAKAARLEQEANGSPDAQIIAAEAWEKAAEPLTKTEKTLAQRRAYGLYVVAVPSLTGLSKVRSQQKLDTLADQLAFTMDIHLPTKVTLANGSVADAYTGMIGRVVVGNKDTGILVRYLPGRQIRQDKLAKLVQETKAANASALTIQLIGTVALSQDGMLHGSQRYEAVTTGVTRLLVDRKEIFVTKPSGSNGSRAKSVPSQKGEREIGWELLGDTSNCELNIRHDGSFGPLASVFYTKDNLEALRRKLVKGGKPKEFDLCD